MNPLECEEVRTMTDSKPRIELIRNGPARLMTERLEIKLLDGKVIERTGDVYLCRCGHSKTKPFCDGSHATSGFKG
jgi:CDGSH-type Zn-finger protein